LNVNFQRFSKFLTRNLEDKQHHFTCSFVCCEARSDQACDITRLYWVSITACQYLEGNGLAVWYTQCDRQIETCAQTNTVTGR